MPDKDAENHAPVLEKPLRERSLADELDAIALRCANRPVISPLSDDEILGYDESAIPAR